MKRPAGVTRRRFILVAVAVPFALSDLVHKAFAGATYHHERSSFAAAIIALVIIGLAVFVPRLPSRAAAAGAGVAAGGALANLVSLMLWSQGVPDPLVLRGATEGIAFNLADLYALAGDVLLLTAVAVYVLRRPGALHEPA
jgi:lipoprotein signal peptidase